MMKIAKLILKLNQTRNLVEFNQGRGLIEKNDRSMESTEDSLNPWIPDQVHIRNLVITIVIARGFCVVHNPIVMTHHGFLFRWMYSKWLQIIMLKLRFTIWKQWN